MCVSMPVQVYLCVRVSRGRFGGTGRVCCVVNCVAAAGPLAAGSSSREARERDVEHGERIESLSRSRSADLETLWLYTRVCGVASVL